MYLNSLPWLAITVILCSMVNCSPLPDTTKSILDLIRDLNPSCSENPLLNETTNTQLSQCSDSKALNKIGLNCVSFLDINRRLCAMSSVAHFNWTQTFKLEQYKEYTPEQICDDTKYIAFDEVPEYPKYKDVMQKVFSKRESCIKLCMGDDTDVLDVSANYFCKVFSYGCNFLKIQESGTAVNFADKSTLNISTNSNQVPQISEIPVTEKIMDFAQKEPLSVLSSLEIEKASGSPAVSTETKTETTLKATSTKQISSEKPVSDPVKPEEEQKSYAKPEVVVTKKTDERLPETSERKPPTANHASINLVSPGGSNKVDFETLAANNSITNLNLLPIPAANDNQEMNPDDDYEHESDGEEKPFDTKGDEEIRLDNEIMLTNKDSAKIEGYMPSDIEDYSDEDESSFFPMFFFGICTMVMLYILYHNKNKIMGLLIEGRQSNNRRRTSRGHAYKKLDTLEQAISSNAPGVTTSKIIY